MKKKERFILERLNRFFLSDVLEESKYEYNRYDAENNKYIVEIKHRDKFYKDTIIEFDKFSYNILYAKMTKKFFIYVVRINNKIYVFNKMVITLIGLGKICLNKQNLRIIKK